MLVQVVTFGGLVIDGTLRGHPDCDTDHYYVAAAGGKESLVHRHDVLPYGFRAPSAVLEQVGQHTNCGIVVGIAPDSQIVVECRDGAQRCFALGELQLLPSLAGPAGSLPHRVGSSVLCRRRGKWKVERGVVVAAKYDLTYTVRFDGDGVVESRVLHSDVKLIDDAIAEPAAVRDRVVVSMDGHRSAMVIECLPNGKYRVMLEGTTSETVTVDQSQFVDVYASVPPLRDAQLEVRQIFEAIRDPAGHVLWRDVRAALVAREAFGSKVSLRTIHDALVEMCIWSKRPVKNMLTRVRVEDDDMQLTFAQFEFVFARVANTV